MMSGISARGLMLAACGVVIATISVTAGQLKTPSEWRWRIDGPGAVTESLDPKGGEMTFVAMPPGWHITTGPGALLYHPEYQSKGKFAVEAEIFLFEGTSQDEYGIFVGGKHLSPSERPSYLAFVARRDGKGAIRRGSGEPIVDWKANDAIAAHPGKDTVKNILRVEAGDTEIVFTANGKEVARIPGTGVNLDGLFGLRLGKDLTVHVSRLDVTHKLAPVPVRK